MSSSKRDSGSEKDDAEIKQDIRIEEAKEAGLDDRKTNDGEKSLIISDEERKLVRKLDWRILPIACLMYLFAFLDRSNLGNARLQGLPEDTLHGDPTGTKYDWVFSSFYFSYILFQVPSSVIAKLFPPRLWLGAAALGWGLCSTLMATAFNFAGLLVTRIGLGIFEAGFGPGIPVYLSLFYTKHEMGLRMAYWFGFAAVAGAFGGLIAFGIQHAHAAIANWRLLFVVEVGYISILPHVLVRYLNSIYHVQGIPALILGLVAVAFLPDRPEMTRFLNEDERKIAIARMNRSISGDTGLVVYKGFLYLRADFQKTVLTIACEAHVWAALKDWRVHVGGVIYFGLNCALASISAFLPTIIKTFGFTNAIAQLLTVPPYAVAAVVLTLTSYASDRFQHRGIFMAGASAVGGIGYLILLTVTNNVHAQYFAVFCITSGTYTTIGLIIAWYAHNLGSETKRATGIPMFMAIGQCGSVLGSHIYPSDEGPRYIKGFAVTCALEFLAALCSLILSSSFLYLDKLKNAFSQASYFLDNRRRDRLHGRPKPEAKVDVSELADKAPTFRYVT
ncbi:MFS general substrate transporter [Sanghuangporus baumii]|uniref:MFS general substrate transporter n=1 Tax=Sanghuangporus baumii TaxID=108892 RepID=A0A9Q5N6Q3_SANBA|nr:MFS general substrate transporter [Sanghuangporus baumii]